MRAIVADANVFTKLLHPEHDSDEAKMLFETCVRANINVLVPQLFLYEILEVTSKYKGSINKTLEFYKLHKNSILTTVEPTKTMWLTAEKITQDGHPNSGFPSMYDAIYQAVAIEMAAIFITADKRHYEKSKQHGNIALLRDWEDAIHD